MYSLEAISLVEKPWEMSSSISLSLVVTGLSIISEEQTVITISKPNQSFCSYIPKQMAVRFKPVQTFTETNVRHKVSEVKFIFSTSERHILSGHDQTIVSGQFPGIWQNEVSQPVTAVTEKVK